MKLWREKQITTICRNTFPSFDISWDNFSFICISLMLEKVNGKTIRNLLPPTLSLSLSLSLDMVIGNSGHGSPIGVRMKERERKKLIINLNFSSHSKYFYDRLFVCTSLHPAVYRLGLGGDGICGSLENDLGQGFESLWLKLYRWLGKSYYKIYLGCYWAEKVEWFLYFLFS